MSTDWFLYCIDCEERGLWGDNTDRWAVEMRALADAAPELARFHDVVEKLRIGQMCPILHIDGTTNLARPQIDLRWFKRHEGHRIAPMNEYGHLLDECARPVACSGCGASEYCRLRDGHDPPCNSRVKR